MQRPPSAPFHISIATGTDEAPQIYRTHRHIQREALKSQLSVHRKSLFSPLAQRWCVFGSARPMGIASHIGSEIIRLTQLNLLKSKYYFLRPWLGSSVTQSYLTLCDLMDCSTPGFPVLYHLPELAQSLIVILTCWFSIVINEYKTFYYLKDIVCLLQSAFSFYAEGMESEKEMVRIPCTDEPLGLQSIGSQRVRHDWSNWAIVSCNKPIFPKDFSFFLQCQELCHCFSMNVNEAHHLT